jgi:hypothetical protein
VQPVTTKSLRPVGLGLQKEKENMTVDHKYVKAYEASVQNLAKGTSSTRDFVFASTGWLQLLEDAGGVTPEEAVSRRTVWSFPKGHLLVVSHINAPVLVNIKKEFSMDAPTPLSEVEMESWEPSPSVNGYRYAAEGPDQFPDSDTLLAIIEKLTAELGEPKLLIPWKKTWIDEFASDYDEESFENQPGYLAIYRFAVMFSSGKFKKASPWVLEFIEPDDYMPKWCHYKQFRQLLEEVKKRKIANVQFDVWSDEISEEAIEEIRAGKDKYSKLPIIWIPKWTADHYIGDGCIYTEIEVEDPVVEKKILELANELKLDLTYQDGNWALETIEDESWEPTGIIEAQSEL